MTKLITLYSLLTLLLITACSKTQSIVMTGGASRDSYEKFATHPFGGLVEGNLSGVLEDGRWESTVYVFGEDGNVIVEGDD